MPETTDETTLERRDYSQAERDAMDESDFGDPENEAFPIKTAQDVIHAAERLHNAKGDQAAIKARITRIAKRKGFPLPQTWQDEDHKERAMPSSPDETPISIDRAGNHAPMSGTHSHAHAAFGSQGDDATHEHEHEHSDDNDHHHEHAEARAVAGGITSLAMYMPITRSFEENGDWIVEGQVTSELLDYYDTIFDYESAKRAFSRWRGNVREQHDPKKAVGKGIKWWPDDENKRIMLRTRVSKGAPDTWQKVLDDVLTGYSVSLDPRTVKVEELQRGGKRIKKYSDYDYLEVSLVDAPGSPNCNIQIVRADGVVTDVVDTSEEAEQVLTPPTEQSLERAGARVSADTMSKMHQSIAHTLHAAVSQMQNCGCDNCMKAQKLIDPDGDGDIDIGSFDDPDQDADSLYNGRDGDMDRALAASIERILQEKLAPVYARLQGIAGTLARANSASPIAIDQIVDSSITRALQTVDARLADLPTRSSLDEVRADLSAVKGQVERIAETPIPGAPVQYASATRPPQIVDKRLPTDPYQPPQRSGSSVYDAIAQMSARGWLDTPEKQTDALTAGLLAQQGR